MKALPEQNLISEVCDQKRLEFQIARELKKSNFGYNCLRVCESFKFFKVGHKLIIYLKEENSWHEFRILN